MILGICSRNSWTSCIGNLKNSNEGQEPIGMSKKSIFTYSTHVEMLIHPSNDEIGIATYRKIVTHNYI